MKAQDLRIGNIIRQVEYRNGKCDCLRKVTGINQEGFLNIKLIDEGENMRSHHIKWFMPVFITEELLIKMGFEVAISQINPLRKTFNKDMFHWYNGNHYFTFMGVPLNITYIHELQNLYYSLTNKELSL